MSELVGLYGFGWKTPVLTFRWVILRAHYLCGFQRGYELWMIYLRSDKLWPCPSAMRSYLQLRCFIVSEEMVLSTLPMLELVSCISSWGLVSVHLVTFLVAPRIFWYARHNELALLKDRWKTHTLSSTDLNLAEAKSDPVLFASKDGVKIQPAPFQKLCLNLALSKRVNR